jgi:DNA-binding LacI/PurR family transcriptional regulator
MRVSLKMIAAECGCSVATVSQVLNGKNANFSSERTKKKIRETASKLGYFPNYGVKMMRGEKINTVAVLISMRHAATEEYIRKQVLELLGELESRGYASYFTSLSSDASENIKKIKDYLSRGVESFIILNSPVEYKELEKFILGAGKNLVSTSTCFNRYVKVDMASGVKELCKYFYDIVGDKFRFMCFENIMFSDRTVFFPDYFPKLSHEKIRKLYLRACPQFEFRLESYGDSAFKSGYQGAKKMFETEPEVQAVMCQNDAIALGVAAYIVKTGRIIGKDVHLGGVNNDEAIKRYPFPISSVDHDSLQHSKILVNSAFSNDACQQELAPIVCIRDSQHYFEQLLE